jgi:hypothetical protein
MNPTGLASTMMNQLGIELLFAYRMDATIAV